MKETFVAGLSLSEDVDYTVFHSPCGILVQKVHAQLMYNDFCTNLSCAAFTDMPLPNKLMLKCIYESVSDKNVEKTSIAVVKDLYKNLIEASMRYTKRYGNMYTSPIYSSLMSLVSVIPPADLFSKGASMPTFGSVAPHPSTLSIKRSTAYIHQNGGPPQLSYTIENRTMQRICGGDEDDKGEPYRGGV